MRSPWRWRNHVKLAAQKRAQRRRNSYGLPLKVETFRRR